MPRTVPVIANESPGGFIAAALWMAQVAAIGNWVLGSGSNGVPRFRGYATSAQSLSDNVWTSLNLDTEQYDSDNGHSTSTNTSRYTVQVAGTYRVAASVGYVANVTNNRAIRLAVNGNAVVGSFVKTTPANATGSTGLVTTADIPCVVGDYIEAMGNQNSGAALNTVAASDVACSLTVAWISG
ncbi:hypothetical protein ACFRDV_21940 [Streptomyces fagopyri]|uniref:hypothetical protein n=1 Tax=Streptomyces fagopyri TaxID=2662397 RepID=UPI0036B56D45